MEIFTSLDGGFSFALTTYVDPYCNKTTVIEVNEDGYLLVASFEVQSSVQETLEKIIEKM